MNYFNYNPSHYEVRCMKSAVDHDDTLHPFQKLIKKRAITAMFVPPMYRYAENWKDQQDYYRSLLFGF